VRGGVVQGPDDLRAAFEGKFLPHLLAAQSARGTIAEDGSITFITAGSARAALPGTAGLAAVNGALHPRCNIRHRSRHPL
jgi:hypothetical protein